MLCEETKTFRLKRADVAKLEGEQAGMVRDYYAFNAEGECWLAFSDPNQPPLEFFVNHAGTKANLCWDDDTNHYVAARDIVKGEELTSDYATVTDSTLEQMK